jgi:hypothetical protein
MYDEAGVSFGGPSGGGITSADLGGGPSFGGDSGGYDNSVVFQPTTAALGALGPGKPGDSGITTILNNVRGFLGNSPIVSRGIGGLLGSILGNVFLPGFGGLLGGYLGQQKAQNYVDRYNLNKEAMSDLLGGKLNNVNIFGQPEGIVDINRPDRMMFADLTGGQKKALDKQKMGLDMGLFTIDDIRQNISPLNDPKAPATIQDIKQYYGII